MRRMRKVGRVGRVGKIPRFSLCTSLKQYGYLMNAKLLRKTLHTKSIPNSKTLPQ